VQLRPARLPARCFVRGDRERIAEAIQNLSRAASTAARPRTPWVRVSAEEGLALLT
jgi:hypothetical protein